MAMPNNLILVRHGQSEGNLANKRSRKGDHTAFTDAFRNRASSQWRLTDRGIQQAKAAGLWLRTNFQESFHRLYASEYIRAAETAYYLDLPDGDRNKWFLEILLRERDYGSMDVLSDDERQERFADELRRREMDPYVWAPPGGESIARTSERVDRLSGTFHRECSGQNVGVVCHGEVMWAFRVRLERMPQRRYRELHLSKDPVDKIHNGQILHYTRIDPTTGQQMPYLSWFRSICPTDLSRSRNAWEVIARPRYTNAELLDYVESIPRLLRE